MTSFWKYLYHSVNNFDWLTQWESVPLGPTLTYTTSNLNNLSKFLEANQFIDWYRLNNKNRKPHHDLPKSLGEKNPYVLFGYSPLTIWYHTQVKISGSMNYDPINSNVQPPQYFFISELINYWWIVFAPKRHPCYGLPQAYGWENPYVRFR